MVTNAFQDIINRYIENLSNIFATNKEEYDVAFWAVQTQLKKDLDELQNEYPLLTAYNRAVFDNCPDKMLNRVKKDAGVNSALGLIAVGPYMPIRIGDDFICQPDVIDMAKCNIVLSAPTIGYRNLSKDLSELVLNMMLSAPNGRLHLSFVNLGLSDIAFPITQNLNTDLYKVIIEQSELDALEKRLSKKLKQKITTGKADDTNVEIVVILEYPDNKELFTEKFSMLFKRGKVADIHFIIHSPNNDTTDKETPTLLDLDNCYFHTPFPLTIEEGFLCHCNYILDFPNLLATCYDYINQKGTKVEQPATEQVSLDFIEPTECFEVSVGTYGDNIKAMCRFDSGDHAHAFLIGQQGSGKSQLLHRMLVSLINKYSPEDLKLYLLDLKEGGVELNAYRNIKHTRTLLVDNSDRQIILEILRDLNNQMKERAALLRQSEVSKIDEYNRLHPDKRMPRILFVVDECHVLFKTNDTGRSMQTEVLGYISKVAREGRSQGVHLFLATQTLSGADIPAEVLNNIKDFYLMRCVASDSNRLVDCSDKQTGELQTAQVYYHGVAQQYKFQVFRNEEDYIKDSINKAVEKSAGHQNNGQLYFNGSQHFVIDECVADFVGTHGKTNPVAAIGRSISLNQSPISVILGKDYSENVMLFGHNKEEQVMRATMALLSTLVISNARKQLGITFYVLDCLNKEDGLYADLLKGLNDSRLCKVVDRCEWGNTLRQIAEDIKKGHVRPVIIVIIGQESFRELKMDIKFEEETTKKVGDTNTFGNPIDLLGNLSFTHNSTSSETNVKSYREALACILDKGPINGVHTILQIDKPNNLMFEDNLIPKQIYSRFKHLVMLNSKDDIAPRLGLRDVRLDLLNNDMNRLRAYYYLEENDSYELITPYEFSDIKTINELINKE